MLVLIVYRINPGVVRVDLYSKCTRSSMQDGCDFLHFCEWKGVYTTQVVFGYRTITRKRAEIVTIIYMIRQGGGYFRRNADCSRD